MDGLRLPCGDHSIINPVARVEVLSPSMESYDHGAGLGNDQQILSLMEYIIVAQDEAVIERFVRQSDGAFVGMEATLAFAELARSHDK